MKKYDVIIVGSGAAGMMAAWKAAKAGLTCLVVEKDIEQGYAAKADTLAELAKKCALL